LGGPPSSSPPFGFSAFSSSTGFSSSLGFSISGGLSGWELGEAVGDLLHRRLFRRQIAAQDAAHPAPWTSSEMAGW